MACATLANCADRTQSFDREPDWEARNNRSSEPGKRKVRQDFGYSRTRHAGGAAGEIGGYITPAAEPAYYAAKIAPTDLNQPLAAAGTLACPNGAFHVLLGFFNSRNVNEWRTPNSIALRLNGRGDRFYAYLEYATSRWRAGADSPRSFTTMRVAQSGRIEPQGFDCQGVIHRWSLQYDPQGNEGRGAITATIDGETSVCHLDEGHKQDGAAFDRFGLLTVMKSVDGGGEIWLDDIEINGMHEDFAVDPKWDGFHNRREYTSGIVRPRFDFGFSLSNFAGGRQAGELGGVIFRGDCREPGKLACYADRIEPISLEKPLKASGKVALTRGVSDSGVLIGFFNSRSSMQVSNAQDTGLPLDFFGISTDAPSRDGFYFAPTYRLTGDHRAGGLESAPTRFVPDGKVHEWTFEYRSTGVDGGEITVVFDGESSHLKIPVRHREAGARFDRFGIVTPWVDGNSQSIYFDDLTYTCRQD